MGFVYFDFEQILEFHYRKWIQPGDTVVDIGAHIGRHLGPMIELIGSDGSAIAFEPIPFAFSELSKKYTSQNITLHNIALSNYIGNSDFIFADGAAEESGLIQRTFNSPSSTTPKIIPTRVDILDNHTTNLDSLSFIKIDIEGGEINCLLGAVQTINKFRPVISVEYGELTYSAYGNNEDTLFQLAESMSYAIYDIFLNRITSIDEWRSSLNYVYWDFILVPREKLSEFESRVVHTNGTKMPNPMDTMISWGDHNAAVTTLRNDCSQTIESLQAQLSQAIDDSSRYRSKLQSIQASTSWKITSPIRRIVNLVKRAT